MRKALMSAMVAVMLVLGLSLVAAAQEQKMQSQTWTGWISDSGCGAKGMAASHKACALACVKEKGMKYVFVNSESKQVFAIHNQDAVSDSNVGMEVKLTGHTMDDGSIHVENIAAAQSM